MNIVVGESWKLENQQEHHAVAVVHNNHGVRKHQIHLLILIYKYPSCRIMYCLEYCIIVQICPYLLST